MRLVGRGPAVEALSQSWPVWLCRLLVSGAVPLDLPVGWPDPGWVSECAGQSAAHALYAKVAEAWSVAEYIAGRAPARVASGLSKR